MNLATLLTQKPAPIPPGIGRLVTQKRPEDDIVFCPKRTGRVCTKCGTKEDGSNFYNRGVRCKKCQKEARCLDK